MYHRSKRVSTLASSHWYLPVTLGSQVVPAAEGHDLGKGLTISKQSFGGTIRNSTKVIMKPHQKKKKKAGETVQC